MAAAQPRFALNEIGWWADHYAYADDAEVESIGRTAGQRGWYTKPELIAVARWKTRGRSVHWCLMNSEASVNELTAHRSYRRDTIAQPRGPVHSHSSARFLCIDLVSSVVGRSFLRPRL